MFDAKNFSPATQARAGRRFDIETKQPFLLIVGGAPASGKTTLATTIARDLGLPLLTKDLIKESLFDTIGAGTRERSAELSRAGYAVLYAVAERLIDARMSAVLEANFRRGISESSLRLLVARCRAAQLFCHATFDETLRRYAERAAGTSGRHPGHDDSALASEIQSWFGDRAYAPLDLSIPVLRVDTTNGYNPDLVAIQRWLASAASLSHSTDRDTFEKPE